MRFLTCILCALLPALSAWTATNTNAVATAVVTAAPAPGVEPATNAVTSPVATIAAAPTNRVAFVIPVKGPIDSTRLYILKRGLAEAEAAGAGAVVLEMDTLGGALLITDEMTKLIMAQKVPTYTFVEKDAISAGAIIAMSTDRIYMKQGSRIGDAMPVMMSSSGGGYESLGEAEREKITSPTDAMVRLIAERKGRDIMLARCMVRRELEYKIGDTTICPEGEILTMTNQEAARIFGDPPKALLSEGTVEDIPGMLEAGGKTGWTVTRLEEAPAETLANLIATVAPLLIALASLLFYLEMNTPGFSWAGIGAIVLFAIYFFGQHAAGLAGREEIIVFALGVILIVLEILVIPGFGLAGITGLVMVVGALFASMVKFFPDALPALPGLPEHEFGSWDRLYGGRQAMRQLSLALLGAGAGGVLLARWLPGSRLGGRMVLSAQIGKQTVSPAEETSGLLGRSGLAETDLRPAGRVRLDDRLIDVISSGDYLAKGTAVVVVQAKGSRVVVEAAAPGSTA
jgi:membrane-bound serine protease (ClpP class)